MVMAPSPSSYLLGTSYHVFLLAYLDLLFWDWDIHCIALSNLCSRREYSSYKILALPFTIFTNMCSFNSIEEPTDHFTEYTYGCNLSCYLNNSEQCCLWGKSGNIVRSQAAFLHAVVKLKQNNDRHKYYHLWEGSNLEHLSKFEYLY